MAAERLRQRVMETLHRERERRRDTERPSELCSKKAARHREGLPPQSQKESKIHRDRHSLVLFMTRTAADVLSQARSRGRRASQALPGCMSSRSQGGQCIPPTRDRRCCTYHLCQRSCALLAGFSIVTAQWDDVGWIYIFCTLFTEGEDVFSTCHVSCTYLAHLFNWSLWLRSSAHSSAAARTRYSASRQSQRRWCSSCGIRMKPK